MTKYIVLDNKENNCEAEKKRIEEISINYKDCMENLISKQEKGHSIRGDNIGPHGEKGHSIRGDNIGPHGTREGPLNTRGQHWTTRNERRATQYKWTTLDHTERETGHSIQGTNIGPHGTLDRSVIKTDYYKANTMNNYFRSGFTIEQ